MNEKEMLFAILRTEVCGAQLDERIKKHITPELLEPLFNLAGKHALGHLVGHSLGRLNVLGADEASGKLKQQAMRAVYHYMQQTKALQTVCGVLEAQGYDHMPLKGPVIQKYYPQPWMRIGGDLDVLVREQQLDGAVQALTDAGFRFIKKSSHELLFLSTNNMYIELHYALIEDTVSQKQSDVLKAVWERATVKEGTKHHYELPDDLSYFYHVAHMAKHVKCGGCGIKPFLDMWILNHRVEHDKAQRTRLIEQGDLTHFADAAEKLTEAWFSGGELDVMSKHLEHYTLEGGVFGSLEQQIAVRQLEQGSKLKYALSKIFIPYDLIKYRYPILEKYRWLTPFCQVRRWCSLLFGGGVKRSVYTLRVNAKRSRAEITSTQELIAYLGL